MATTRPPTDDDLVDDYVVSDVEDAGEDAGDYELGSEDDVSGGDEAVATDTTKKRKAENSSLTPEETAAKKAKKKQKFKEMKAAAKERRARELVEAADSQNGAGLSNVCVSKCQDHVTYFWNLYCNEMVPRLSDIEKEATMLTCAHFAKVENLRSHSLDKLPRLLDNVIPGIQEIGQSGVLGGEGHATKLSKKTKKKFPRVAGSPLVVLISSSAIRAVEVRKSLLDHDPFVAKLFAKHMKVEEQQKTLSRPVTLAVGTPNRLLKLSQLGSLNFAHTKLVVLDMCKDKKNATLLEQREVRQDMMQLFHTQLREHVNAGTLKMALF